MSRVSRVAVVGAGIVGLSVAHVLKLRHGSSVEIHIIASIIDEGTTSSGAGGLWEPYRLDGTDVSFVHSWSRTSLQHFLTLHDDESLRAASGVRKRSAYQLLQDPTFDDPSWHDLVKNYQRLDQGDLQKLAIEKNLNIPARFQCGYSFDTVVADPTYYLAFLETELKKHGVTFTQRKLMELSELDGNGDDDYDFIVNCTGLGAADLVDDGNMCPIRGQVRASSGISLFERSGLLYFF
jgi:D-amino-acid oxidase